MMNNQYKIELIFKSKETKKVLHRLESILNKKETMEDYKDEEIFKRDINEINDKLINALKLFGHKWIIVKDENRTQITVPISDNEFDLRLVVTLQQLALSVENYPNIYQFELIKKESVKELNQHIITRLNKQYSDVVYVISSIHNEDNYFIIYNKPDSLISLPLRDKWKDNENNIHDILNNIEEVHTVPCINNVTTSSITYIKSSNLLENIITEYTCYYNSVKQRHDDLTNNPNITQGLDEYDNPNLENDLLMKMNKVYSFDYDNEHDKKVFEHSVLHYHKPNENVFTTYVIFKQGTHPKVHVAIIDYDILMHNLQLNKPYFDKHYKDKVGLITVSIKSDSREVNGIGFYSDIENQEEYEKMITDCLSIAIRGNPIYD